MSAAAQEKGVDCAKVTFTLDGGERVHLDFMPTIGAESYEAADRVRPATPPPTASHPPHSPSSLPPTAAPHPAPLPPRDTVQGGSGMFGRPWGEASSYCTERLLRFDTVYAGADHV